MSNKQAALKSIIERFYEWEENTPDAIFLRQPHGQTWHELSYAEAGQEARRMAAALQHKGLVEGDHVGILSKNCYHWILADLAIMMGGYVSVPYYASLPTQQLADVIALSDIKLCFVGKLDTWDDKATAFPDSVSVIKFPHYQDNALVDIGEEWSDLVAQHASLAGRPSPKLDDLWTIKFTSGTTGTPKGVMHSHRTPALIMDIEKQTSWIGIYQVPEVRCLSYLPLNHVGERMGVEVPCIFRGGSISFAESLDSFAANIQNVQPTIFFGVPRIWTKFHLGIIAKIPQRKLNLLLKIPVVSSLVKKKLLHAIGMSSVQVAATGAAITPGFLKDFYQKLGIHLVEAYGMTEVCGSICNSPDPDSPQDTVGKAVPQAQVKIDPETQEVLMKSPANMLGYYKNPEKTKSVLRDGWIHSGDRGEVDADGWVRITGRISDAFKTAKGSYVSPNRMEEAISKNDHVAQVCVVGLGIPQPIALINLSDESQALAKDDIAKSVLQSVEEINQSSAKFERISTAVIIQEPWSEEIGILTPTLKIKRGQVDQRYMKKYLDWDESKDDVIWV